jgi:hypothetical protein
MFDDLAIEQLMILQRALLEAKFSPKPRDTALPGSQILAELSTSVVRELRERYAREGDEVRARQWAEWSRWSKRIIEQEIVRGYLSGLEAWPRMSADDRSAYARILIAPFEATEDEIAELVNAT